MFETFKEKKEKFFYSKEFLNLDGHFDISAFFGEISLCIREDEKGKEAGFWTECMLKIANCTTVLQLDFLLDQEEDYRNSLHKVDVLIDNLIKFKKGMMTAYDRGVELNEVIKKNKKRR